MAAVLSDKRLYLDTSVVSALFDDRAVDRQRMTLTFWETLGRQTVFISTLVQDEIEAAPHPLREKLIEKAQEFSVLPITPEAEELAQHYVEEGVFSERFRSDALHVAVATVNRVEYLVSWNFAHMVKVRTRQAVNLVNALKGYPAVEIIAPPEL
jgi:predicted nucleic acid-binding protein